MNIFQKVPATVRKYIYVAVTIVVSSLVAFGILDKSVLANISDTVALIAGVIAALSSLMAAANVNPPSE